MNLKRFFSLEWDAIAGIMAAWRPLFLHSLQILEEGILLSIIPALLALLFISFLRHQTEMRNGSKSPNDFVSY